MTVYYTFNSLESVIA